MRCLESSLIAHNKKALSRRERGVNGKRKAHARIEFHISKIHAAS